MQGQAFSSDKVHNCYYLGMNGFLFQYLKQQMIIIQFNALSVVVMVYLEYNLLNKYIHNMQIYE